MAAGLGALEPQWERESPNTSPDGRTGPLDEAFLAEHVRQAVK
jgi:hypothetical protein